jgi:tetratricopeptide (TPR) repeat protein
LGLLTGCGFLRGGKKIARADQVAALLYLAEGAPDFPAKESFIKQAVALDHSKWPMLKALYMEQVRTEAQLDGKLFYLLRILETIDQYSMDYHSLDIYRELGNLHYTNHDIDQALIYYNKMIDIESNYVHQREKYNLFFESLLVQYPDDCLMVCRIYLDIGDRDAALTYLKESAKYFYELQQKAYKDKTLFSFLADKFPQLGQLYALFGLQEEQRWCHETGLRFKLLDLDYKIDEGALDITTEAALKKIIAHEQPNEGETITNARIWAKFLLAKYYAASDLKELAVDLITQVLDSDFEYLANVGNIMTVIRYIPWRFIFQYEDPLKINVIGYNQRLLELVLRKYHNISDSFYKKFTLDDLHNWLLISLLAEDYYDVDLILRKSLELKPKLKTDEKIRLYNILLHNIGVAYFRKSNYNIANIYLKQYYDFAHDQVATFNLAVLYLVMNDFSNAHRLLSKYERLYPNTVFSAPVKKYLKISENRLNADESAEPLSIALEQSIVPIAK